jgi:hypothetical protein
MLIVNPDERATINDVVDYSKKQLEIIESKISHSHSDKKATLNKKEGSDDDETN